MQNFLTPTIREQDEFLLRLYFGNTSPLLGCVDRAYLDLSRTLHGIGKINGAAILRAEAGRLVVSWLEGLVTLSAEANFKTFDARHRHVSKQLCSLYPDRGYPGFSVGQAQKWLNMALKYVYVFGEERMPGFEGLYHLGHVPLDSIILGQLQPFGAPQLSCGKTWSRLRSYEEYLNYQEWIRQRFLGSAPLAVEFHLWGGLHQATARTV